METEILDVLGVGFGPSALALAIAVQEHNEESADPPVTARFLERKPAFGWHRGMLIEGATMQVAFLKDLATPRNPVSRFGFVPYLHDQGRLIDFINHKCFYPSRVEFHDYLTWCARRLEHLVDYGHEVVTARPVTEGGVVTHVEVVARDLTSGAQVVHRARNIVVAPGLEPRMPDGLPHGARVRHSSTTLDDLRGLGADGFRRFVVLGAGQSAAEVVDHLHRSYPAAEVHAVFSRFGYSQADDSPFANRIFDPATVDAFHQAPQTVRDTLLDYHANTNYSVVDVDLIEELYRRTYDERLTGRARLHFHNVSAVDSVAETTDGVDVTVRHLPTGRTTTLRAHLLICATGYRPADPFALLGQVGAALHRDEAGLPRVERDYRVAADARVEAGVYLCGATEHSHGITSSLLSNTAVRAGEILGSVLARRNGGHSRVHAEVRGVAGAGQASMGAG